MYLGVILKQGVRIDQSRIEDICSVRTPASVGELQSFLDMTNFVASFIQGYTDITAPLRDLLKKDVTFVWQLSAAQGCAHHCTRTRVF